MNNPAGGQDDVGRAYLAEARRRLAAGHERIRHCLGQLDDAQVWWRPRASLNSVGNLLLHLCGNLRQWIVSGVGGAPDTRDRPAEFAERGPIPKGELLRRLDAAVGDADAALAGAAASRLLDTRRIQGFDETVLTAVFDALAHLSGHAQEIVYITRLQLGDAYRFAWTPATPEQGASPEAAAGSETVAVRDATFEEMPGHPLAPASGGAAPQPAPAATETVAAAGQEPSHGQVSSLKDYLLDLEEEFQEDEEQGKL